MIRRKVQIEGLSQREAARELGHSRKTVAKALELRIPPVYRFSKSHTRPVLDPFRNIIDAWIEQNQTARSKHRQTAKRMHERLQEEYGLKDHYGTVWRYGKEAAHRQKEVFMPLQFEPAEEAQVDWHEK
mgnify:FL=1